MALAAEPREQWYNDLQVPYWWARWYDKEPAGSDRGTCVHEAYYESLPSDVDSEARIRPLYHPGFNSTVQWSADRNKFSVTFFSCGGCARTVDILTTTKIYNKGVSWTLDGGERIDSFQKQKEDRRSWVLNPGVHILNITNLPIDG